MSSAAPSAASRAEPMTSAERRASFSLASIVSMRMLGLFLILPVFVVHARTLPGGDDPRLVGLALGIYGLMQGLLHLPFGMASDRYGRKRVIIFGLVIFALGSFLAAGAETVMGILLGRAVQGAGAVSAAVSALVADSTRDSQRTKAMALVGGAIGMAFAVSVVASPLLYTAVGLDGMFVLTGLLALSGIGMMLFVVPDVPAVAAPLRRTPMRDVLLDPELFRLNLGMFVLHAVQMSMFVVVPRWLLDLAGLPLDSHWKLYLLVVLVSFVLMVPPLILAERRRQMRAVFVGSVALLVLVAAALVTEPHGLVPMALLLLLFFTGFNILEALLPSLVSRLAPPDARGTALGVYNTTQALGLFVGGALGGWVYATGGGAAVFGLCVLLLLVWLVAAIGQKRWFAEAAPQG